MKFYIKKKGTFTLEIMYICAHENTLFIDVRGFNSAVDKKLITKDDLTELCKRYSMRRIVISDYDYSNENTYILTINRDRGYHYTIAQNGQILVKDYL